MARGLMRFRWAVHEGVNTIFNIQIFIHFDMLNAAHITNGADET